MAKPNHGSKDPSLMSAVEAMACLNIGRTALNALRLSGALVPVSMGGWAGTHYRRKEVTALAGQSAMRIAETALATAARSEAALQDILRIIGLTFTPLSTKAEDVAEDYAKVKRFITYGYDMYETDMVEWANRYATITPEHMQLIKRCTGDMAAGEMYVEFFRRIGLLTQEGSILRGQVYRALVAVRQSVNAASDTGADKVMLKVRQVLFSPDSRR
jgi:hypothetical protein